jgi:excisionase family DNA binding protein
MTQEPGTETERAPAQAESIRDETEVEDDSTEDVVRPEDLPPVATVAEIARFLRVRQNLVYAMHRRGEIPGGQRLGRAIRFSTKVVIEWLNSGEPRRSRRKH